MKKQNTNLPVFLVVLTIAIVAYIIFQYKYTFAPQKDMMVASMPSNNMHPVPTMMEPTPTDIMPTPAAIVESSWRIYTDEVAGFSISYPANWTVDTRDGMYGEKGASFDSGNEERIGSVSIGWIPESQEPLFSENECNNANENKEMIKIKL